MKNTINNSLNLFLYRIKKKGGWLILLHNHKTKDNYDPSRSFQFAPNSVEHRCFTSICFLSDNKHRWRLKKEYKVVEENNNRLVDIMSINIFRGTLYITGVCEEFKIARKRNEGASYRRPYLKIHSNMCYIPDQI